jgi:hypothetical protein
MKVDNLLANYVNLGKNKKIKNNSKIKKIKNN